MLAVHHWDTDGIASAALVITARSPEVHANATPDLGRMHLDGRIRDLIKEHEDVYVLDLNLPGEMEAIQFGVTFIDHHIQERIVNPLVEQINPILNGRSPSEYPSASIVVSEHLDVWNHLSSLGAIGDIGSKAFDIPLVRKHLDAAGLGREETLRIVDLIDSSYIVMDKSGVEESVEKLMDTDPMDLLDVPLWNRNLDKIDITINNLVDKAEVKGEMAYLEFSSDYQVISKIARKLVWDMGSEIAIVVNKDFNGQAQTYVRISQDMTEKYDMYRLIRLLKGIGINCGGKSEVMGSIFKKEKMEEVQGIINNQFGKEENNK